MLWHILRRWENYGDINWSINHFTESGVSVVFPGRLNYKVGEPSVEDRIENVDVDLVEASC